MPTRHQGESRKRSTNSEVEWIERDHGNAVSARWIFQTAVRRQFPLALEVTRSDDPKFDARIELQSPADEHIRKAADEVVQIYLLGLRKEQGRWIVAHEHHSFPDTAGGDATPAAAAEREERKR